MSVQISTLFSTNTRQKDPPNNMYQSLPPNLSPSINSSNSCRTTYSRWRSTQNGSNSGTTGKTRFLMQSGVVHRVLSQKQKKGKKPYFISSLPKTNAIEKHPSKSGSLQQMFHCWHFVPNETLAVSGSF